MAFAFNNLTAYVEQRRLPLIKKAVLTAKSASLFNLQTDIKTEAAINLINTDVKFGDGSACGWNEAGTTNLSQRTIKTGQIKVNQSFCDKELLKYWTQYEVRVAAGQKTLPFEEAFVDDVITSIKANIEKAIWQGDTDSDDVNLNKFDGLIKILGAAGTVAVDYAAGSTAKEIIDEVYEKLPAEVFSKDDAVIFVGNDMYRKYVSELVAANLFHYNPGQAGQDEYIYLPGSNVRVIGVDGLNNTGKVVGGNLSNFFFGCDMVNDEEKFELWYSQDNREFRLAVEANVGVQIAWPDQVVFAKEE